MKPLRVGSAITALLLFGLLTCAGAARSQAGGYQAAVLADSPVGYWRLGESSGSTGSDLAGSNNLTYEGGYTLGQPGSIDGDTNTSASLNGINGHARKDSPSPALNLLNNSWTVEAWAKTSYSGTREEWIASRYECGWSCGTGGPPDAAIWGLYLDAGGHVVFRVRDDTGILFENAPAAISSVTVRDGQWHHLVGVLNRSAQQLKVYIDGAEAGALTYGSLISVTDAGSPFAIGRKYVTTFPDPQGWFEGQLDEVAVYNSALPLVRVQAHHNAGATAPPPTVTPNPALLDDFNRANETPVSQSGNWAPIGISGGSGARLHSNRLQNFAQPGTSYRTSTFSGQMEASAAITTLPSTNQWLSVYVCLQDAGTAGWDGYELRSTVLGSADLWEIRKVVNGTPSSLASSNFDMITGGSMLLRRLGNNLEFWWKAPGGDWSLKLSTPDSAFLTGRIGIGGQKTGALDDFGGGDATNVSLLQAYAPELRFTDNENYRADSAAIATDLFFSDQNNAHTNFLDRPDGSGGSFAVAAADPNTPLLDLSLNFLTTQALPGDFLSQPNFYGNEILSAATDYSDWVLAHPEYRRFSYARAIVHPTTGEKILQYWLFYYYNPKDFVGFGKHEGDWEWVQVRLSPTNVPMSVALSQHGDGEKCDWGPNVGVSSSGHPVVYVAHESHANYFWAGSHLLAGGLAEDVTRDDGQQYREVPNVVNVSTNAPRWIDTWDGHWGASFGAGQSPRTPGKQSPWLDPWAWHDQADACTLGPPALRAASAYDEGYEPGQAPQRTRAAAIILHGASRTPPLPNIRSARIVMTEKYGRAARVSYCFRSLTSDVWRRPWRLHLTLENLADALPPLSIPWRVTKRCTVVTQPVGGIKPPYLLRYAVESRRGTWSKRAQMRIR